MSKEIKRRLREKKRDDLRENEEKERESAREDGVDLLRREFTGSITASNPAYVYERSSETETPSLGRSTTLIDVRS